MGTNDIKTYLQLCKEAKTEEEKNKLAQEWTLKFADANESDKEIFLTQVRDSIQQVRNILISQDVKEMLSLAYVSKKYFGKSRAWLVQKINGNKINGRISELSVSERETLKIALLDMAKKLNNTASLI